MQQHQAASSSASGSRRHLFAIPSSEKTGSLADVAMHKPAGYTQQVISDRYHVLDQKWQVTTRTLGALQAIGGGLEVSFGVELAATGVGAIPGVLLVGSGIDNLGAGAHTFISGQSQQTTLEMVMTQNGVSAGNAATIQAGADFALNLGGTAAMHAPEMYQMGTRLVSSIAEPISQFAQRTTQVISEQIGEMYRQYPGRAGWSFFGEVKSSQATVHDIAEKGWKTVGQELSKYPATSEAIRDALARKYSSVQNASVDAVKVEILDSGNIKYYGEEAPSSKPGPTRGAAFVTEFNPRTGEVRTYMESYDQSGNVNRIHPKSLNGVLLDSPHFPPTLKDILNKKYGFSN